MGDCRRREEFISLSVDFVRGRTDSSYKSGNSMSMHDQGNQKQARKTRRHSLTQSKRHNLVVGYKMNNVQFSKCTPVNTWSGDFDVTPIVDPTTGIDIGGNETRHRKL